MMKHFREWRTKKDWQNGEIIEDKNGWPIFLKNAESIFPEERRGRL